MKTEIFLATGNAHKVAEMQTLAETSHLALHIRSAREIGGMPAVAEDTGTFVGNASKKARALHAKLDGQHWVLADDSGLCVDALGGAPGVESAYYAGPHANPSENLQKLVATLRPIEDRRAHFLCVLFLIAPDGTETHFTATCQGTLLHEPRGGAGFGYDPLFVPDGFAETFAELGEAAKSRLSHRALAWKQFAAFWRSR